MSVHHLASARTPGKILDVPEDAEIREIYPGASNVPRTPKRGKLSGSEAGMATAEYAHTGASYPETGNGRPGAINTGPAEAIQLVKS